MANNWKNKEVRKELTHEEMIIEEIELNRELLEAIGRL